MLGFTLQYEELWKLPRPPLSRESGQAPSAPSAFPGHPSVTDGHKHVPDVPRHLFLDDVLHVIVGHLDKLLKDWPQEKPHRWGVSFNSEGWGRSPLPRPPSSPPRPCPREGERDSRCGCSPGPSALGTIGLGGKF